MTVGFAPPTSWATGTAYVISPASTVFNGGKFYTCLIAHTSGTFATDLAAGKWALIADLTAIPLVAASQIGVTANGGLVSSDVQTSLNAIDAGKATTSHNHPASAISDSTAAGRNLLTAANVAAQQSLLGLGSLAFLNSLNVTQITSNLAFIGVISPAALGSNTNDWQPTGWATSARVRFSASAAINITGLLATTDGDIKILDNIGSFSVTLPSESTSSAAANRIATAITIPPLTSCTATCGLHTATALPPGPLPCRTSSLVGMNLPLPDSTNLVERKAQSRRVHWLGFAPDRYPFVWPTIEAGRARHFADRKQDTLASPIST